MGAVDSGEPAARRVLNAMRTVSAAVAVAVIGGVGALAPFGPANAGDVLPMDIPNLIPPVAVVGQPAWDGRTGGGRSGLDVAVGIGNHYVLAGDGWEELLIDGETWRLDLRYRRRFGDNWSVRIGVPWMRHSGGFLDATIDAWHGTFNLPDGNRDLRAANELLYLYKSGGRNRYLFDQTRHGVGDVRIDVSRAVGAGENATLMASLKVPTGDPDALTGSGATDLALSFLIRHPRFVGGAPAGVYWGAGALRPGRSEVFSLVSRKWVAFGVVGAAWRPWRHVGFKFQLDMHSNYFSSSLDELGSSALQASVGGWWESESGRTLTLALSEDLIVKSAPDFGIHVGVGWNY